MADPWVMSTQLWYNTTYGTREGFQLIAVDGQTGWQTIYALTRALQSELGIAELSDTFGSATFAALSAFGAITSLNPNTTASSSNLVKIAQAALYCKGYNAGNGDLSGTWNAATRNAVASLRDDLGLGATSSDLTPKLFKFLLTMNAAVLAVGGDSVIREGQRAMNARYLSRRDFYVVASDGLFTRETYTGLMFALQFELEIQDGVANGNFGPTTRSRLQDQGGLSTGSTDNTKFFVHWFNFALRQNGYASAFSGSYTASTAAYVSDFQAFVGLPSTGAADIATWSALLVSTGDPNRPGTGADCITTLTDARLSALRGAGYTHFGRYLTNTPDDYPDKCLKWGEIERIHAAGGRLFPVFQTGGGSPGHFTYERGKQVAEEAGNAAWAYRIPRNSIVYFTVDYDAYDWEVTERVIPYFQGIRDVLNASTNVYRVGVYGPRNVCTRVTDAGLAESSFVSDMSTGYSGNLGQKLPRNWAFDQIQTTWVGFGNSLIEIDKNVVSGRDPGVSGLTPPIGVGDDPLIPASQFDAFEDAWFGACVRYPDTSAQIAVMALNRQAVRSRVETHDAYITALAGQYNVYKALIMTPLIWEGMVINAADDLRDAEVRAHYQQLERTGVVDPLTVDDCSTGAFQIFARTAIAARNYACTQGLITDRLYDATVWQDRWEVWKKLNSDEEYNITTALFTMMMYANEMAGVATANLRQITPSQVIRTCYGYNGDMIYGRSRMQLYYVIHRWHDSFR